MNKSYPVSPVASNFFEPTLQRHVAANLSGRVSRALLDFMIMAVLVPTYHKAVTDSQQLFPTSFEGGLRQHDICSRLLAICIAWSRE